MIKQLLLLLLPIACLGQQFSKEQIKTWEKKAQEVTIVRDTWGIPHIFGKTDANVVFGLMYSECEDNFERVERNYLEVMGRLSEVDGVSKIYDDLQMKLIYDSTEAKKDYENSPDWFKKILNAFADGVNYYLATHPNVHAKILDHFEPWFPLMYTDGSISATQTGGLTLKDMKNMYPLKDIPSIAMLQSEKAAIKETLNGSNGFAFAPSRTLSGNAMLYINPHVTFYFRTESHVKSEEGLDAYGALTWGQFFVYQGFNEHCGWMHTSSYADVADLYKEKIIEKGDSIFYVYDGRLKPVKSKQIVLRYKKVDSIVEIPMTVYYTHHGPVVGKRDGQWLSLKEHNRSYASLLQSWLRTKAKGFEEFKKVMEMGVNNSNNTVFADDKGNIAYWHGNFMPVRDTRYNWSLPVDGSISATEWKGFHTLDQTVHVYNPSTGFIQNCNSTPFTVSGKSSPKKENYPSYMAPDGQNARAINAIRLFDNDKKFDLDKMIAAGYDRYLSAFEILLPSLLDAYQKLDVQDSLYRQLADPIGILKVWDKYASVHSVATTLAVLWGNQMSLKIPKLKEEEEEADQIKLYQLLAAKTAPREQLEILLGLVKKMESQYGDWKVEWGEINRYQRNTGNIKEVFDDALPSFAEGSTSSRWGCLPAFESRSYQGSKKMYGYSGNSFIAAVEFGKKLKARTIETGGESNDPHSKHFTDQADGYINGKLKDIFFYKEDLEKHIEKKYHPGGE
jgi:acyl-homoserine-lactone acylase